MTVKLDTVIAREKLKPRREPYWHRLDSGCMLGFRKMATGSIGSWVARYRNAETGERPKQALGEFSDRPPSERFSAAKEAADAWFSHLGRGGSSEIVTVKAACSNYADHILATKGEERAEDVRARYRRWVDPEPIAKIALPKLTRRHIETWRKKLAATPVIVNPHAAEKNRVERPRSASSLNRDMASLRAALNYAYDLAQVSNDLAWRVALRAVENAGTAREVYLDLPQRKTLITASPTDLAQFLRGLARLPLRPGALAALTVGRFESRLDVLTVGKDKAGRDRKLKLPKDTADFFRELAKDKPPTALLFTRADGKAWTKDDWKKPIKLAAAKVGLPADTVALALRHSAITDLVTGGLDLLTVAQLSGTSVAMIERHYGHLRADHAAAALATLAL
ncbi:site-specific recombinase XerD [Pelomonas saccharophila]|uniref:Site-specific recombinase XerD n=1 Tax=Roseateles saccharophilus TaxID=304 RepID=A0ABU1YG19_ROSSA|nr:tyrosine-type recombinase/integrase [Roseateles saccharophilus]MDR7267799.1 site-specific recombinase XerD [Roseateles saccharophilus]